MPALDVSFDADALVEQEISHAELGIPDPTGVRALVQNGWTSAQTFANQSFAAANAALASMSTAAQAVASVAPIDATLASVGSAASTLSTFAMPVVSTTLSTRTGTPPQSPTLTLPAVSRSALSPQIMFLDLDYSSPELTHLTAQVDAWVQGTATGLPTDVEQAIWDRGRAREVVASARKAQEALRQFAARGFSKPPGALAVQLLDAAQEAQNNDVSFSRDVAIKQADLEQSNRRFAFEMAEKIQGALMQYMQAKMQRAAEIAKALAQLQVEVDAHLTQMYGSELNYYGALDGAQAQVYRAAVDVYQADSSYVGQRNSAEAQVTRALTDAYAANGQFFGQRVHAEAQLQRANADVEIAKGNLRIESAKANMQALIQKATVIVEALRAAAQISGQLAASALAAVNLSGGLHDSTSWGVSVNDSRSRSTSASIGSQSNRQENFTP